MTLEDQATGISFDDFIKNKVNLEAQKIESAPQTGEKIMLYDYGHGNNDGWGWCLGQYRKDHFAKDGDLSEGYNFTHWLPLPPTPNF